MVREHDINIQTASEGQVRGAAVQAPPLLNLSVQPVMALKWGLTCMPGDNSGCHHLVEGPHIDRAPGAVHEG